MKEFMEILSKKEVVDDRSHILCNDIPERKTILSFS
jgi:hypothetical protein